MALAARVLDTIRRHALMRRGDRVLVGAVGRPGFGRAARLLARARGARGAVGCRHRAPQSRPARRGAATTKSSAARWPPSWRCRFARIRLTCGRWPRALGTSLEDAGTAARYELFERVATELGADVIADRAHARRSGRDVPAAAAPRRRAAWARRNSSENAPARRSAGGAKVGRAAAARDRPRRAPRLSGCGSVSRFATTRATRSEHSARTASATSSCRFCRVIFRLGLPMCSRARPTIAQAGRRPAATGSNRFARFDRLKK